MSIPQSGGIPLEHHNQLAQYLADGCKPKSDWRIGTEHEKFGYDKAGLNPLPYNGFCGIKAMLEGLLSTILSILELDSSNIISVTTLDTGYSELLLSTAGSIVKGLSSKQLSNTTWFQSNRLVTWLAEWWNR